MIELILALFLLSEAPATNFQRQASWAELGLLFIEEVVFPRHIIIPKMVTLARGEPIKIVSISIPNADPHCDLGRLKHGGVDIFNFISDLPVIKFIDRSTGINSLGIIVSGKEHKSAFIGGLIIPKKIQQSKRFIPISIRNEQKAFYHDTIRRSFTDIFNFQVKINLNFFIVDQERLNQQWLKHYPGALRAFSNFVGVQASFRSLPSRLKSNKNKPNTYKSYSYPKHSGFSHGLIPQRHGALRIKIIFVTLVLAGSIFGFLYAIWIAFEGRRINAAALYGSLSIVGIFISILYGSFLVELLDGI